MKKFGKGVVLCLMIIFTTASCSTTPVKWYRAGTSQATFIRDKTDCENALFSTGTSQRTKDIYTLEGCLESKGYTPIPPSSQ